MYLLKYMRGATYGYGVQPDIRIKIGHSVGLISIYPRQQSLLEPVMLEELKKEALPLSLPYQIVSTTLGEQVGDFGSLSVGINAYEQRSGGSLSLDRLVPYVVNIKEVCGPSDKWNRRFRPFSAVSGDFASLGNL